MTQNELQKDAKWMAIFNVTKKKFIDKLNAYREETNPEITREDIHKAYIEFALAELVGETYRAGYSIEKNDK